MKGTRGKKHQVDDVIYLGCGPPPENSDHTIFAFLSGDPINLHSPLLLQRKLFQSASTF